MTSYQKKSLLYDPNNREPLSAGALAYFRERLINRLYALVLEEFWNQKAEGLTQRELARRIHKDHTLVNRLLGAPGNWTLDTVSDLLLGMGCEPSVEVKHLQEQSVITQDGPAWLNDGDVIPIRSLQLSSGRESAAEYSDADDDDISTMNTNAN